MVEKLIHMEFEQIVDKSYQLENIINMNDLRKLLDDFHKIAPFPIAVLNLKGDVLLESHWEPICTQFHRVNPKTAAICAESDIHFNAELAKGNERHILYRCANGLYDAASPIKIEGQHLGNFFIGQFLLESPDEGFFRKQAQRYGFEEEAYLEALSRVPIISEHGLKNRLDYLCGFAEFLGNVGLKEFQRDRAQMAFQQSEVKFHSFAEQSLVGIYLISDDGFKYVNPKFAEIFGYSVDECLNNMHFPQLVHPEDLATVKKQVSKRLSEETKAVRYSFRGIKKSGETIHVEIFGSSMVLKGKTVATGTMLDITERKQAEKALRESEAQKAAILDGISTNLAFVNEDLEILWANKISADSVNRNGDEIIGKKCYELWADPNAPCDGCPTVKTFQTKKTEQAMIHSPDGRVWEEKGEPVFDEKGGLIGVLEIAHDITAKAQAEEALRESEKKYRRIFENIQDVYYESSLDGTILEISPSIENISQYRRKELIGKSMYDIYTEPKAMDEFLKLILDKGKVNDFEMSLTDKDGSKHLCSITTSLVKDEQGDPIKFIGSMRDISERKQNEEERKKLKAQLQQAQKMEAIGTLAGGIAHDFNNILGGIIGYAELAKMKAPEGSNVIAYLDKMIKSSDRAADLIKQILTLSRQHKQKQRPVQVRHIIKETLSLLRATLPTTIEIRQYLAKDAGVINADPTQMHQVIMNLGTNAGHAMQKDGGVLEITLANVELDDLSAEKHLDLDAGSYLRLTVSDTGHGMTSEIRERIFDPYFTTKDTGEGTGLGLSVAHGIVKTYGGTITVYSEPGKGTTFHVYLPLILEEEREVKESEEPLPTGSERILFIDDEDALVEIGSQILEQLGYEVVTKQSSVQALELFRAEPDRFDLVITDMTMPHMTGDKLARELMTIRPRIPIILCTGHSGLVSEEKAEEIGIKAFVMKPLVMRNLAETVRKVLDTGESLLY